VAGSITPQVERHGIPGKQTPHELGQRYMPRPKQKVKVVGNQGPGKTLHPGFFKKPAQARAEFFSVHVVEKYISPLDAANHYMLKQTGQIYASSSWHVW